MIDLGEWWKRVVFQVFFSTCRFEKEQNRPILAIPELVFENIWHQFLYIYHLVMTNSLPWKDPPMLKNGKPSISIGAMA